MFGQQSTTPLNFASFLYSLRFIPQTLYSLNPKKAHTRIPKTEKIKTLSAVTNSLKKMT